MSHINLCLTSRLKDLINSFLPVTSTQRRRVCGSGWSAGWRTPTKGRWWDRCRVRLTWWRRCECTLTRHSRLWCNSHCKVLRWYSFSATRWRPLPSQHNCYLLQVCSVAAADLQAPTLWFRRFMSSLKSSCSHAGELLNIKYMRPYCGFFKQSYRIYICSLWWCFCLCFSSWTLETLSSQLSVNAA